MQLALSVAGTLALALSVALAVSAGRAYVRLDIRAVRDDLSGRARQRGMEDARASHVGGMGTRGEGRDRGGEDVLETRLAGEGEGPLAAGGVRGPVAVGLVAGDGVGGGERGQGGTGIAHGTAVLATKPSEEEAAATVVAPAGVGEVATALDVGVGDADDAGDAGGSAAAPTIVSDVPVDTPIVVSDAPVASGLARTVVGSAARAGHCRAGRATAPGEVDEFDGDGGASEASSEGRMA